MRWRPGCGSAGRWGRHPPGERLSGSVGGQPRLMEASGPWDRDEFRPAVTYQFQERISTGSEGAVMLVEVNGVELCVQTFGDPSDPPVLLIGIVPTTSGVGRAWAEVFAPEACLTRKLDPGATVPVSGVR